MTARLEVQDLSVRLGRHDAVRGLSLEIGEGRVLGVVGPNGAGKTTLVDALCGFVVATGEVRIDGQVVDGMPPHRRAALGLGRTFQSLELFEDLSVGENLAVAAEAGGRRRGSADEEVPEAAALAGLDDVLDALPAALSVGRRKQVALGRALAVRPRVLLLDEPAAGLDQAERLALARTVRAVAAEGTSVLVVDHDVGLVLGMCDEVAVLDGGALVTSGRPDDVRSDPSVAATLMGTGAEPAVARRAAVTPRVGGRDPVLELRGLSAGYGGAAVVTDVDLVVRPGEVVALLGANGAGKTTTLLAASGVVGPLEGEVRALGHPVRGRPDQLARRGLAHATQDRGVLHGLTVGEQVRLAAGSGRTREAVLRRFPSLSPLTARRGGLLSGGEQQIVSLARAMARRPKLLLVDELSLGLAPALARDLLRSVREEADRGAGVLLVEQFPALALSIADRAYVLDRGRVVGSGPAAEVASRPDLLAAAYLGEGRTGLTGSDAGADA